MSEFSLIKKMSEEPVKPLLPEGVAYKQFTIRVEGTDKIVHIPLRESENFKERVAENTKITSRIFKSLMREFRGIRNTED